MHNIIHIIYVSFSLEDQRFDLLWLPYKIISLKELQSVAIHITVRFIAKLTDSNI